MAEIIGLPGVVSNFDPDHDLIEFLELLLKKARAGAIVGIAVATVGPQEDMGTGWKGSATSRTTAAAVGLLHHRFFSAWCSDDSDTIVERS